MDTRFPKLRSQHEIDAMVASQTKTPILTHRPILRFAYAALTGSFATRKALPRRS